MELLMMRRVAVRRFPFLLKEKLGFQCMAEWQRFQSSGVESGRAAPKPSENAAHPQCLSVARLGMSQYRGPRLPRLGDAILYRRGPVLCRYERVEHRHDKQGEDRSYDHAGDQYGADAVSRLGPWARH